MTAYVELRLVQKPPARPAPSTLLRLLKPPPLPLLMTAFGWLPGPPPGFDPNVVALDRQAYSRRRCAKGCGRLSYQPIHCPWPNGTYTYSGLLVCESCSYFERV